MEHRFRASAYLIFVCLSPPVSQSVFAQNTSGCLRLLESVAYMGSQVTDTPADHEFLGKFINDDRFAAWLMAQDTLGEETSQILNRYRTEIANGMHHNYPLVPSRTVELTDYGKSLKSIHDSPTRPMHGVRGFFHHFWRLIRINRSPAPLSIYDQHVLLLRYGDTVQFGDRRFRLGEYLGRGDTAIMFALADNPDRVIRIPFLKNHLTKNGFSAEFLRRQYIRLMEQESRVPRVRIIEHDSGFTVVSRVWGDENGFDFLNSTRRKYRDRISRNLQQYMSEFSDDNLHWPNHAWYDEVITLAKINGDTIAVEKLTKLKNRVCSIYSTAFSLGFNRYAIQFVWDERFSNWILVDIEWNIPSR